MDLKDISLICITDSNRNPLYTYKYDNCDIKDLLQAFTENEFSISVYKDQTLFTRRMDDISIHLLARPESNEIFVQNAFDALLNSLNAVIKNWSVDRIAEKYDQIILIFHEFVFNGIILTDNSDDLSERVMKRTFENVNAIKVSKGFASFLNKATKSFRK